jgi:hypothetical protein
VAAVPSGPNWTPPPPPIPIKKKKHSRHIRELPASNLDQHTRYPDRFFVVLLTVQTNAGIVHQLGHDRFLRSNFQFIHHPTIRHYTFSILTTRCQLSTRMYVCMYISIHLSIHPSIYPSIHPSIHPPTHPSIPVAPTWSLRHP